MKVEVEVGRERRRKRKKLECLCYLIWGGSGGPLTGKRRRNDAGVPMPPYARVLALRCHAPYDRKSLRIGYNNNRAWTLGGGAKEEKDLTLSLVGQVAVLTLFA